MGHQDFEKYAVEKTFNYSVSGKFSSKFDECVRSLGIPQAKVRVLDFGCGDGKHYPFYLGYGLSPSNIYGVEISKKRVERCHGIGWKNAFFLESEALPFADNEFDVITMAEVIEHIPLDKINNILSDLARIIKKNGRMMITTPNYPSKRFYDIVDAFLGKKWKRLKDDPTHVSLYNIEKLGRLLGKYFNSVEIVPYKNGFLYEKTKKNFFLHKMLAVCSNKK